MTFGEVKWAAEGQKAQRRPGGYVYPWVLTDALGGVEVSVGPDRLRVDFRSHPLWESPIHGGGDALASARRCWRWIRDYVRVLASGEPQFYVVRIDLAADFQGWRDLSVQQGEHFKLPHGATRGHERHPNGGLTLKFGRFPRCARIYLKSMELEVHAKEWFWDAWHLTPGDGPIVRVEFRWGATNKKGNPLADSLETSDPELVLTPARLGRLWLNATGAPGAMNGWMTMRQGNVLSKNPPDPRADLLDARWEDVRAVTWTWAGAEDDPRAPSRRPSAPDASQVRSVLGSVRTLAAKMGVRTLPDALALVAGCLAEEQATHPASFAEEVERSVLADGGAAPQTGGAFQAAMGEVRFADGRLAFAATPPDIASSLWWDLAGVAAVLQIRGDPAPWSGAVSALHREVQAGGDLTDPRAWARRAALYKLPLFLTTPPGRDPYAVLPPFMP